MMAPPAEVIPLPDAVPHDPVSVRDPAVPLVADPPRILVVDDDQGFREMLRDFLLDDGFDVVGEAPDGVEAVTAADVQRVAKTYFKPENRLVLTLVPSGRTGGQ